MTEEPERRRPGIQGDGAGALVPSTPIGSATPEVMSPEDRGLFGPDAAAEGAPLKRVSASAVLRSKWLILGVFALVAGVAIPCIWMFVKPTYRASALVHVSPVVARMVFPIEENRVSTMSRFYASFVNTQMSVIESPTVRQRVLDQREVQATEWYRNPPPTLRTLLGGTRPSHLERLKGILSVQRQPNAELIDVSVTTLVPEEAAVIADAVVDMYAAVPEGTADEKALDRRRK